MLSTMRNPNLDMESVFSGPQASQTPDWLAGDRPKDWWTGKPPLSGECPGMGTDGKITSLPLPDLSRCTRQQVQDYFDNTWTLNEVLFSALQGEAAFLRPPYHQLRHPMVFYYGHTVTFYTNKLRVAGLIADPINPHFECVFETGVDEMSWDDMSKNEMQWPAVREVTEYRRRIYRTVSDLISSHPGLAQDHAPITWEHPLWALFMAFEHERIHLETSSVLLREMPLGFLRTPDAWPDLHPSAHAANPSIPEGMDRAAQNPLVDIAGGTIQIGKDPEWPAYGWDNEYGRRGAEVASFRTSRYMVSNAQMWAFVQAGGYRQERYWTEAGWKWRSFRNAKWPSYWTSHGPAGLHQFRLRTLFEVVDMPWSWPVVVNLHEAQAYLNWLGERDGARYRLPTEAEHSLLRGLNTTREITDDPVMTHSGRDLAGNGAHNLNLAFGSEAPVDAASATTDGVHDLSGNLWDWCEDDFHPLEGFQVHPYYDDFSAPCYDGEHSMILGGSFISTGNEASVWSRFHFRPHFFQHAGFRIVQPAVEEKDSGAVRLRQSAGGAGKYDQDAIIDQYLLAHYGSPADTVPPGLDPEVYGDFPGRCARLLMEYAERSGSGFQSAFDIGCAVGGASFALARRFAEVTGVDLSAGFIQAASRLRDQGEIRFNCRDQGELSRELSARLSQGLDPKHIHFRRADACALPPEYAEFDAVMLANLVDRLPSPRALLGRLGGYRGLVKPGGVLLITTPYTWLETFTPRGAWLGGFDQGEGPVDSHAGLQAELGDEFELLHRQDLPLVLREHARKFEFIVADATVWRRRG